MSTDYADATDLEVRKQTWIGVLSCIFVDPFVVTRNTIHEITRKKTKTEMPSALNRCNLRNLWMSVFTGSDSRSCGGLQLVSDKLLNFILNQFTIDDPGLFRQHVAVLSEFCRLEKDIPRRA